MEINRIENEDLTPIQQFYNNTNIFITGCTGFLGTILLEKLLRTYPTISTVYVLIRNKKGKSAQDRLKEIFDDVVFEKMKQECPQFYSKIVGIEGDCSLPDLGLGLQDKKLLKDEVDIIFHAAATVRFDEKLKRAIVINIRTVRDLLRIAQEMPKLKSLVHISTAYSNCIQPVIEERIYPPPADYKKLILLAENLPENILDNITSMFVGEYPNTYTFTKQVAESVLRQEGQGLPIGISRPSIVISTYKEPIKGWVNNLYGPTGITAASGLGILKVLHGDSKISAPVVPVDMCVNSIIAVAWETGMSFDKTKIMKTKFDIPVYHYEFTKDKPIDWSAFWTLSSYYGFSCIPSMTVWYCVLLFRNPRMVFLIYDFFLHKVPAMFIDGVLLCLRKPQWAMKTYSKVHSYSVMLSYFTTQEWNFESKNIRKLINRMSKKDKEMLFFDPKELVWDTFFQTYFLGVRLYLIKDPLETLPRALKRYKRLYWLHQATKVVLGYLLLYFVRTCLCFMYNLLL